MRLQDQALNLIAKSWRSRWIQLLQKKRGNYRGVQAQHTLPQHKRIVPSKPGTSKDSELQDGSEIVRHPKTSGPQREPSTKGTKSVVMSVCNGEGRASPESTHRAPIRAPRMDSTTKTAADEATINAEVELPACRASHFRCTTAKERNAGGGRQSPRKCRGEWHLLRTERDTSVAPHLDSKQRAALALLRLEDHTTTASRGTEPANEEETVRPAEDGRGWPHELKLGEHEHHLAAGEGGGARGSNLHRVTGSARRRRRRCHGRMQHCQLEAPPPPWRTGARGVAAALLAGTRTSGAPLWRRRCEGVAGRRVTVAGGGEAARVAP